MLTFSKSFGRVRFDFRISEVAQDFFTVVDAEIFYRDVALRVKFVPDHIFGAIFGSRTIVKVLILMNFLIFLLPIQTTSLV